MAVLNFQFCPSPFPRFLNYATGGSSRGFSARCSATITASADRLEMKIPHVMTVAGSDSGAGAGIQADLKTCAARGVYCSTVVTAITAQNTFGVQEVNVMPEELVAEQMRSVLSDMQVDVIKTGMIPSEDIVKVLLEFTLEFPVRALVVDPVMISTSGDMLTDPSVLNAFREGLLPSADIVTPNLKEASILLGNAKLETISDMRSAAKAIHDMGPKYVLVKGGDLHTSLEAVDVFYDGREFYEFSAPRIITRNTHGTGCTLASCIAAELAKGLPMFSAIKVAKRYVETALKHGKDMTIGNGPQGPFDHLLNLKNAAQRSLAQHAFCPEDLFLYAVTDSRMNKRWGHSITDAVKAAIEGGATIVQLREKDLDTSDFLAAAHECVSICRSKGIPILINDRIDIALACDADGVHIGQSDMPTTTARALLGPEKIIGVSCKTVDHANKAWQDGADYIGCGGVFPTNTKANNITVGLDGLQSVCSGSKLPVVAIGGINESNAHKVMELGNPNLKGVAVVSALFDRECVLTETKKLHALLSKAVFNEFNINID